jgi:hypothetical protein
MSIENVNMEIYVKNLGKCGSFDIYSMEYIFTSNAMVVTTISMTTVKLSNNNPKFKLNNPDSIHLNPFI